MNSIVIKGYLYYLFIKHFRWLTPSWEKLTFFYGYHKDYHHLDYQSFLAITMWKVKAIYRILIKSCLYNITRQQGNPLKSYFQKSWKPINLHNFGCTGKTVTIRLNLIIIVGRCLKHTWVWNIEINPNKLKAYWLH